jgi:hypothetical protein
VCLVSDRQTVGLLVWTKSTQAGANASCSDKCTHSQYINDRKKAIKHWGSVKRKRFNLSFFLCGREYQKSGGSDSGHVSFCPDQNEENRTRKRRSNSGSDAAVFSITTSLVDDVVGRH